VDIGSARYNKQHILEIGNGGVVQNLSSILRLINQLRECATPKLTLRIWTIEVQTLLDCLLNDLFTGWGLDFQPTVIFPPLYGHSAAVRVTVDGALISRIVSIPHHNPTIERCSQILSHFIPE
jgi:hypothetical protein